MLVLFTWLFALFLLPINARVVWGYVGSFASKEKISQFLEQTILKSLIARTLMDRFSDLFTRFEKSTRSITTIEVISLSFVCSAALAINLFSVTEKLRVPELLSFLIFFHLCVIPLHFKVIKERFDRLVSE